MRSFNMRSSARLVGPVGQKGTNYARCMVPVSKSHKNLGRMGEAEEFTGKSRYGKRHTMPY
jgi:hypothetical protein